MAAKFEIRSPKAGQYTWVLISQGRTLATSQAYSTRPLAEKAIVSFQMAAVNAPVVDTTVPEAKTPTGGAARVTRRAVAKAVVTGRQTVEKVEETAAKAAKQMVEKASRAVESVTEVAKPKKRKAGKKKKKRR
jgi:uncharacterized protein YegP (UPF0339 family)